MENATATFWKEFDAANGGDPVKIGGWHVYPSGARREGSFYGASQDPPRDLFERYKLIVAYWQTKLTAATAKFDALKKDALERAAINRRSGLGTPSDADYVGNLTAARAIVRDLQGKLADAKKELERHQPPHIARDAEHRTRSDAAIDRFVADISKIEV